MSTEAPYGTWKSPITSQLATKASVSFDELHVDKSNCSGGVFWTELRPDDAGRSVVCSRGRGGSAHTSWTPAAYSARTTVHEYGGGASLAHQNNVYFSNFTTQQLCVQTAPEAEPQVVTPGDKGWRYADGHVSQKHGKIYYVREDHGVVTAGDRKEPENTVVVIDPATKQQNVLARGADFYTCPRVSPDGARITWIQWHHPNMPWDTTELWMAELTETGDGIKENSARKVAGGSKTSVTDPSWTTDNQLLYVSDITEWWNMYIVDSSGSHQNLHPVDTEISGPHWHFANYGYDVDPSGSGNIATAFGGVLGLLNHKDKSYRELRTGYTSHKNIQYGADGKIYCVAASPTQFSAIICLDPRTDKVDVLHLSRESKVDDAYISVPDSITWPTTEGEVSHGYLYLPKSKDYVGVSGELPPLLVKVHGGPTGNTFKNLNLKIQYFTSRGFAILDVNYCGSTSYGKAYRHRLHGNWGIFDVEDCCSGALYLAEKKQVDAARLCIDGGSAGGYTTLAALAFKDVFKAGTSLYGVGDVEILMKETHKFESRYIDSLICPYNEENLPKIHARSPIKHMDGFSCPIAFFQGSEDKVVPPNQAELMFNAVKDMGLPCAFVLFEGEQHGFRKAENIRAALDGEFYFFARVFGFEPADKAGELPIYNLD